MRTPPVRPADGVVGLFYESFVPGEDCCGLGLRPLIVSRIKCGGRTLSRPLSATMYGKYDMPSMGFLNIAEDFDIGLPETRSGRDKALPI